MRCFLAIPLAEPALGDAQRILHSLRQEVDGVRWARPETLHITMHFFGNIDATAAEAALSAVTPAVQSTLTFEIVLDKLGTFPPRGWPRVLWLGASQESAETRDFAFRCRLALQHAGLTTDDRPFRAHCTLGRPRLPWTQEARRAWESGAAEYRLQSAFMADRLVLFESTGAPGGAIYTPQATVPFGLSPI